MRIGVDIRPLQNNNRFRGIGRYLDNVLRSMAPLARSHNFIFYAEKGSPLPRDVIELYKHHQIKSVAPSRLKRVKYIRALARPYVNVNVKPGDVDVFFQGDPWLGIPKNVPTVATFYDLIPKFFTIDKKLLKLSGLKKYKQLFGETVQAKFYKEMLASYKSAKAILAISQASKNDYLAHVDSAAKAKVFVTPMAGSEDSFPKANAASRQSIRRKYRLGDSRFLLYVGGIDLRKNIAGLAKDFIELKKRYPDLKLVMAGKEFNLKRDLKTVGWLPLLEKHPQAAKDILAPGYVPDDELAILYAEAVVLPFPSRYEGFGMPILEAMHAGCPVIAYNNSSIPEVAGDAALLVRPGDSMVPAIEKVLNDAELRKELITKGHRQAKKFTWQKTARRTLRVLESIAGYRNG